MPQNQEEIEAKLAAYIDGELDAAGRAEIEKHLQANPQHRTLIADLMKQRELVRSLPHASAPTEIAETLQGQLERSVLLGSGVDVGDDTSMRMSPWPHRGAIAAIVLLTAGLSFLVYKVLPSNKPSPELAVAPQSNSPSNSPATLSTEPPTGAEQPIASAVKDRVFTEKFVPQRAPGLAEPSNAGVADKNGSIANAQAENETAVAAAPGAIGGAVGGGAVGGGNFSNSNNAEPLQMKAAPQELAATEKQLSPPQYLIVTTDDPAATDAQVRAFLIANQIHFTQQSNEDSVRSMLDTVRQVAESGWNTSTQPTTRELVSGSLSGQISISLQTSGDSSTLPSAVQNSTASQNGSVGTGLLAVKDLSVTTAPTTAPASGGVVGAATEPLVNSGALNVSRIDISLSPTTQPSTAPVAGLAFATTQPAGGEATSLYCTDVTAAQVEDLKSMLSLRAGQNAQLVKVEVSRVPVAGSTSADGSFKLVAPTTQQAQAAVDQQIAAQQSPQFGVGQQEGQAFLGQQVPSTQPSTNPAGEKLNLLIVMRPGVVSAKPPAVAATQQTQPAVVPISPSATQPSEPVLPLKIP